MSSELPDLLWGKKNSQWVFKKTKGNKFPKGIYFSEIERYFFMGKNIFGKSTTSVQNILKRYWVITKLVFSDREGCSWLKAALCFGKSLVQPIRLCSFCVFNWIARSQPPKLVRNDAHAQAIRQGQQAIRNHILPGSGRL